MNENLNLVELLKDCPKGTKLYSTLYGEVYLKGVDLGDYPISFTRSDGCSGHVTSKGVYRIEFNGECTLFPSRDQRDWSKWYLPFVDGDIIFIEEGINRWLSIFMDSDALQTICYLKVNISDNYLYDYGNIGSLLCFNSEIKKQRLATEEEKEHLFNVIREKGYKWNAEKKVLKKLSDSKFKDGDVIINNRGSICIYKGPMFYNKNLIDFYCGYRITDCCFLVKHFGDRHFGDINEYRLASEEEKQKFFDAVKGEGYKWNAKKKELEQLIKPKFKVGDVIQDEDGYKVKITEVNVEDECYEYESIIAKGIGGIVFSEQNDWKLIPNKFDINTLKPFDKVLVRTHPNNNWFATFFSHINYPATFYYKFATTSGLSYKYMIPYNEETEYLLGTNNEAPEYYKDWED